MTGFTQQQQKQWFDYCTKGDAQGIEKMLGQGFNPDERDAAGRSGLWLAATAAGVHHTELAIARLLRALRQLYKDSPGKVIEAVTSGINGHMPADIVASASPHSSTRIARTASDAKAKIWKDGVEARDPEIWFELCRGKRHSHGRFVERYLGTGFDPDMRDDEGRNGLWHTIEAELQEKKTFDQKQAGQKNSAVKDKKSTLPHRNRSNVCSSLINALISKYHYDYPALVDALENSVTGHSLPITADLGLGNRALETMTQYQKLIDMGLAVVPVVPLPTTAPSQAAVVAEEVKLDNTLTAARLQETLPNGRTQLQKLTRQKRLAEVFTLEIWAGRVDELEAAWALVPETDRAQVPDIGKVRIKARFTSAREPGDVREQAR